MWRVSFMIEHEFCMAADISKILAMGELSSWAGHRRGKQTFSFIRVLRDHVWHGELLKRAAPITISLFIKTECFTSPRSLELLLCRWARLMIGLTWNPSVNGEQIHYLGSTQWHFVFLHLRSNLQGSPTACSYAYKQPILRVIVDDDPRC